MKNLINCAIFLTIWLIFGNAVALENASTIVRKSDEILNSVEGFDYITEFKIYRGGVLENEYTMRNYVKGKSKMLILFLTPLRIKDQAILKKDNNQWIYFPKIKRALKISLRQQLAGSDFSYGDILDLDLEKEYEAKILNDEALERDIPCYELELTAKEPTATYDRIICYVRRSDYTAIKREFYTKSGQKFKELLFKEHDREGIPRVWEMSSALRQDHLTVMTIKEIERKSLADAYFSLEYLRRDR